MASVLSSFKCFALRTKHEGKYLQSVYRKKAGGSRIEASADAVAGNARTRFFVEESEEEDGLVHVRCCYNNKYWVALEPEDSGSGRWIIGTADEPGEDLSSPKCTLFAAKQQGDSIRFHHRGLDKYACVLPIDDKGKFYLQLRDAAADDEENTSDVCFTVLGLSQQKELPKYVAFKQSDGNYIGLTTLDKVFDKVKGQMHIPESLWPAIPMPDNLDTPFLGFHTNDLGDGSVIWTVHTNDDGTVRIQSTMGCWFWVRGNQHDTIMPGIAVPEYGEPFKVITGDGYIALQDLGNKKFLKLQRIGKSWLTDGMEYLAACDNSISYYTRLQFDEPVVHREIYDVKFRLDEARIYNTTIVSWLGDPRENDTDSELTGSFSFEKTTQVDTKWQTSVSTKSGFESSISAAIGEAPFIVNGGLKLSWESTSSHGKETSESKREDTKLTQDYKLPPRTTIAGRLVAFRSSSDVPYSYKQRIVLTNGEEFLDNHDDGIYTISNNHSFRITITDNKDEIKKITGKI